jgi:chromosome segregation ATPase
MTTPEPKSDAVQDQRLAALEKMSDSHREKLHGVDSVITSIRMQTELLEQEVQHLKKDYYKGLAAQRQEVKDLLASLQLQDKSNADARLSRAALRSRQDETARTIKWILGSATAVAVGTAITVLSGAIQ